VIVTVSIDGRTAHARTDAVANAIGGAGTHVARYTADFARLDSVRTLTDALTSDFPRIDVLLDNAGGAYAGDVRTVDGNEINYQVNALPPFLLTKSLTPALDGGLVVRRHRVPTAAPP
jgi:NAD(P)-dependent dehydrogenase (short-subunit alcohol dehydrogenase family)